jgi:hypothetical protein
MYPNSDFWFENITSGNPATLPNSPHKLCHCKKMIFNLPFPFKSLQCKSSSHSYLKHIFRDEFLYKYVTILTVTLEEK